MRFAIICLISLLLVPALGSEQQRRPPSPPPYQGHPPPYREHPPPYLRNPPPPPERRPLPRPGNFVYYQGSNGPSAGIVLGSRPDRQGHYALAPVKLPDRDSPRHITVYKDAVVKAHPGDIRISKGNFTPEVASRVREGHARMKPQVSYASGPIHGSPNYIAEHGGNHGAGRRGA